jgi:hypothetical protein
MFELPELTELSQTKSVRIGQIERVGGDVRLLARITSS